MIPVPPRGYGRDRANRGCPGGRSIARLGHEVAIVSHPDFDQSRDPSFFSWPGPAPPSRESTWSGNAAALQTARSANSSPKWLHSFSPPGPAVTAAARPGCQRSCRTSGHTGGRSNFHLGRTWAAPSARVHRLQASITSAGWARPARGGNLDGHPPNFVDPGQIQPSSQACPAGASARISLSRIEGPPRAPDPGHRRSPAAAGRAAHPGWENRVTPVLKGKSSGRTGSHPHLGRDGIEWGR